MDRASQQSSKSETYLSLVILAGLFAIGVSIFFVQFHFNPALLQQDSVIPTIAEKSAGRQTASGETLIQLPQGLVAFTPLEFFNSENLSDKINGKAELYLSAGFAGLRTQRFKETNASVSWLEVYEYDMGSGQSAFAVFSTQRRESAETLDFTQYAYRTQNALFFVHGPFYVEIIASEASEALYPLMELWAKAFIRHTQAETETIAEKDLFPTPGLSENSISMISTDAFGYERLDRVFTAAYRFEDTELTAFVSGRSSPQESRELATAYREFLITFGGRDIDIELSIAGAKMVEILDTYEVIFSQGPYLAGVREAADQKQAEALAERLYTKIKEVTGEPK